MSLGLVTHHYHYPDSTQAFYSKDGRRTPTFRDPNSPPQVQAHFGVFPRYGFCLDLIHCIFNSFCCVKESWRSGSKSGSKAPLREASRSDSSTWQNLWGKTQSAAPGAASPLRESGQSNIEHAYLVVRWRKVLRTWCWLSTVVPGADKSHTCFITLNTLYIAYYCVGAV